MAFFLVLIPLVTQVATAVYVGLCASYRFHPTLGVAFTVSGSTMILIVLSQLDAATSEFSRTRIEITTFGTHTHELN